jgi:hypothetical protein
MRSLRLPWYRSRRARAIAALVVLALLPAWYLSAYPRGMLMACIDHARGRYEVREYYGLPGAWEYQYAVLLRTTYRVELRFLSESPESGQEEWFTAGYNDASRRLLIIHHGSDIFAKCASQVVVPPPPVPVFY